MRHPRHIITRTLAAAFIAVAVMSCSDGTTSHRRTDGRHDSLSARDLESMDTVSRWESAPVMNNATVRMKVNYLGNLRNLFNDSNYVHWAAADSTGISPLGNLASHWHIRRPIVKITSCRDFFIEPLTYSVPYLVPEAAAMVHEIGRRFTDSVAARGGSRYRMRITSVTRTPETVRRLLRRNVNAVDSSVHQLGTTVDISYARFIPDEDNPVDRSVDDLKGVLAEVLAAMRREGKLYVKFERQQPCFHVTVRPHDSYQVSL